MTVEVILNNLFISSPNTLFTKQTAPLQSVLFFEIFAFRNVNLK